MGSTGHAAVFALVVAGAASLACGASPAADAPSRKPDPGRCATCHLAEYLETTRPMHPGAKPTTCGVCHASTAWHPSQLDHPFWVLTGAHEKTACFDCHQGTPPVFHGTSKVCVDCHRKDFDGVSFVAHASFSLACASCHTTAAWKPATEAPPAASAIPPATATARPVPTTAPTGHGVKPPTAPIPRPTPTVPTPRPTPAKPDVVTQPSKRRPW